MGNKSTKKLKDPNERKKSEFSLHLQHWSTGWNFTDEHKAIVKEEFFRYNLQDVLSLFFSIIGEYDDYRAYYRLTYPTLCDINKDNTLSMNYYIPSEWIKAKKDIRMTIMGYGGSGKSNLVLRLVTDTFMDECDPTIEDSYRKNLTLCEGTSCFLDVLDTAGREEYPSMLEQWVRESDCVIIVYNISGPYSPEEAIEPYFSVVRRVKKGTVLVAATKNDLRHDFAKNKHNLDKAIDFCKQNKLCYIETSAKDNINVHFLFQYAVYNLWFDSLAD
ncbi:hypothetical protein RFI_25022 [Reticulomyxa filosa]|uniref:Uncharacterized protein n=1 Tax=Reticulomyxa filosa TaxID=46433 RepID=X6MEP0_RETFI|nr:hypothetical protein RFI_25022 [Reticulomyxa filosa]|eukprot:ETO12354.1 hypothetical protein RFI_25022 [Reticulomyxa filosa]